MLVFFSLLDYNNIYMVDNDQQMSNSSDQLSHCVPLNKEQQPQLDERRTTSMNQDDQSSISRHGLSKRINSQIFLS